MRRCFKYSRPLACFIHTSMVLWITCPLAHGWGELGHRIIAENGAAIAGPATLERCHLTARELTQHVNDPDRIWRQQNLRHPREAQMHFFHVDAQPGDWRTRSTAKDRAQGELIYRISDWCAEAIKLKNAANFEALHEHLFGLAHYLGDLSQPLHLTKNYDGQDVGLPGLHSQFETKMLNRFEDEVRKAVSTRLQAEKIPTLWSGQAIGALVRDVAMQSQAKASRLFAGARESVVINKPSRQNSGRRNRTAFRFDKKRLWAHTGTLAADQLALGSRLVAFMLEDVCR